MHMNKRLSAESRLAAAFLVGMIVLCVAAGFAVSDGIAYIAAEQRAASLRQFADVLSDLSSTMDASEPAAPTERAKAIAPIRQRLAAQQSRSAAARRAEALVVGERRAAVERSLALVCVLTIALGVLAYGAHLRNSGVRRRLAARVEEEQSHDPLTGLPNRRFFAEWLSYAIAHARRQGAHVGVLFIDIDGCAAVTELHGEQAADALLVEIARRFRAASRGGDLFARLDTTQFALATPHAREGRELALLAQRMRDELNDPAQPPLADSPIGASIGLAFFPEDADDTAGVMAAANTAMYAARRAGRNHIAFHALAA